MHDEASDFGFNDRPPIDLPAAARSVFPDAGSFKKDLPGLAKSAIGQESVRATPLQMALVAAGIVNGGSIMKPHVMAEVRDSDGNQVKTYEPSEWKRATSAESAQQLKDLMVNVVANGTGKRAQVPGAQLVGGKTGTAQTVGDNAHAWFIGFAEANGRKVAVSVIVESQEGLSEATGGAVAAPIAGTMLKAALGV
jgi:peptidoglycan glycosyltransferase